MYARGFAARVVLGSVLAVASLLFPRFSEASPRAAQSSNSQSGSWLRVKNSNLIKPSKRRFAGQRVECNFEQTPPLAGFSRVVQGRVSFSALPSAARGAPGLIHACPASCQVKANSNITLRLQGLSGTVTFAAKDSCGLSQLVKSNTNPRRGSLILDHNQVTYRPNSTFLNSDNFVVAVGNGRKADTKKVAVKVSAGTCSLSISDLNISVGESTPSDLPVPAQDSCGIPVTFLPSTDPSHGTLSLASGRATYTPDMHFTGSDDFTLQAEYGRDSKHISFSVHATVSQLKPEFAGIASSLEPYRTRLTANEVTHLLRKAAMGGNQELYQIGINGTRGELVEALLNYVIPPEVEAAATAKAEAVREIDGCLNPRWFSNSNQNYWLYHMRYGSPLREEAALQLHDHFAINLDSVKYLWGCATSWGFREHREKIHQFALGSFAGFTLSLPLDTSMSYWLDNRLNRYGSDSTDTGDASGLYYTVQRSGNQNFGRELMELFTIGKFDPYTGQRNYSESDIELATRAESGFHSRWTTFVNPNSSLPILETGIQGTNNWYALYAPHNNWGATTMYDQTLAFQGPLSLFQSIPGAAVTREFTPWSFIEYLLYEHPAGARNIAYSFFSRYAYVHPTEEMTNELAALLKESHYDMKIFLRRVLNSSAMFSELAHGNCINSPVEFMMQFLKSGNFSSESLSSLATQRQALVDMNHNLLNAPNVFAWGMCGDSTLGVDNHGEPWLQNQMLLNRYRTINNIIAQQNTDGFAVKDLLFSSWNNPSANQVLARFEQAFNLPLSGPERTLVMSYLDRSDAPWNPANATMVRERLAGLAFIFGTHLKSMLQ